MKSHLINYKEPSFENILRFYPLRKNLWPRKSAKEWCLTKRYCTWPQESFPKITFLSKYLRMIVTSTKNLWYYSSQAIFRVFWGIVECRNWKTRNWKGTIVKNIFFSGSLLKMKLHFVYTYLKCHINVLAFFIETRMQRRNKKRWNFKLGWCIVGFMSCFFLNRSEKKLYKFLHYF